MSFNGIQRHVTRIDLRTMRPSEKQKVVDRHKREYCREHHCCEYVCYAWEPTDATEIWIKESRDGELFKEFVARLLQKQALVEQRNNEPEPTVAHPLMQALADVNDEARRVVWRLGNDVEYEKQYQIPMPECKPPKASPDSGGKIDKA